MSLFSQGIIKVVSDPELKQVGEYAVVKFYGGIQEGKDKNGQWINNAIDCEIWGKQANTVMEYVGKGGSFNASGTVRQEEWTNKEGEKRRKHVFKIQRVELLPRSTNDAPTQRQPLQQQQPVLSGGNDDLPF